MSQEFKKAILEWNIIQDKIKETKNDLNSAKNFKSNSNFLLIPFSLGFLKFLVKLLFQLILILVGEMAQKTNFF